MKKKASTSLTLDDRTRALLGRAIRRVPARDANTEMDSERLRQELVHGRGLSYEVLLQPGCGFGFFATQLAPRLVGYLSDKKIPVPSAPGVFLSVFAGDELVFLQASEFFEALREAEGLDPATWRVRLRSWGLV